jgi:hypothetical protein
MTNMKMKDIKRKLERLPDKTTLIVEAGNCSFTHGLIEVELEAYTILANVNGKWFRWLGTGTEGKTGMNDTLQYCVFEDTRLMDLQIESNGEELKYMSDFSEQDDDEGNVSIIALLLGVEKVYLLTYCSEVRGSVANLLIKMRDPRSRQNSLCTFALTLFYMLEQMRGYSTNE